MNNLKLGVKIGLGFALIFVAIVAFGAWTFSFSVAVENKSNHILTDTQPFVLLAQQMSYDTLQVQQWLTDISATRALDGLNDGFDEAEISYLSFMAGLDKFEQMFRSENDTAMLNAVKQIRSEFDAYYRIGKKMAQSYIDEGPAGGNLMMSEFDGAVETLQENLEPFLASQIDELTVALNDLNRVGGRVAPAVLPHHRTYGSVYGGSRSVLKTMELLYVTEQSR
ncbi:hypothetical protein ICT70_14500, partial [Pelobacter sp. M08fum]|nr:hypothetical protein [Pelovirga terrestris]